MRTLACVALAAAAVVALPNAARADVSEQRVLDETEDLLALVPGNRQIEPELFPALAGMDAPPGISGRGKQRFDTAVRVLLFLTPESPDWATWSDWAASPAQQAALEALRTVTDVEDLWMFAHQLGRDAVEPEWARAGLYTDTGPLDLIAAADPLYAMQIVERLHTLAWVDAQAACEEGDGERAIDNLLRMIRLYRLVADRHSTVEKELAFTMTIVTGEQLRDLLWRYVKENDWEDTVFDPDVLVEYNRELDERVLRWTKVVWPEFTRLGGQQLVARTMSRDDIDSDAFARDMAVITSAGSPLQLFNQRAVWRDVASFHGGQWETLDQLDLVHGDYQFRWTERNLYDPFLAIPTSYEQMDKREFAMIKVVAQDDAELFDHRRRLLTEMSGLRTAIGLTAFRQDVGRFAPNLSALQPNYVATLRRNEDHFNYNFNFEELEPLEYRTLRPDDQIGPREDPQRRTITLFPAMLPSQIFGIAGSPLESIIALAQTNPQEAIARFEEIIEQMPEDLRRQLDRIAEGQFPTMQELNELAWDLEQFFIAQFERALAEQFEGQALATRTYTPDTFYLYSVGLDGRDDQGLNMATDRIFFPPTVSMIREVFDENDEISIDSFDDLEEVDLDQLFNFAGDDEDEDADDAPARRGPAGRAR